MKQIPAEPGPASAAGPAAAIRRLRVPQVAPPYDDEPATAIGGPGSDTNDEGNGGRLAVAAVQLAVPQAGQLEPDQLAAPQTASQHTTVHNPDNRGAGAGAWPGQFAQVLAETLAGSRPHRQLAPWTTEQVRRQIRQLGPLFATGDRPLVRRVMTAAPASGVLELTAVVGLGPRIRVLALRLERERAGRAWCCTAIESA
jgi:Family of unknown function (DUF6459)